MSFIAAGEVARRILGQEVPPGGFLVKNLRRRRLDLIEQVRHDRGVRDVAGDVLAGVLRAEILLIDVLLPDVPDFSGRVDLENQFGVFRSIGGIVRPAADLTGRRCGILKTAFLLRRVEGLQMPFNPAMEPHP